MSLWGKLDSQLSWSTIITNHETKQSFLPSGRRHVPHIYNKKHIYQRKKINFYFIIKCILASNNMLHWSLPGHNSLLCWVWILNHAILLSHILHKLVFDTKNPKSVWKYICWKEKNHYFEFSNPPKHWGRPITLHVNKPYKSVQEQFKEHNKKNMTELQIPVWWWWADIYP